MKGQPSVPASGQSLRSRTGKGYLAARPPSGPPPSRASWRLPVPRQFVLRRRDSGRPCHHTPGAHPGGVRSPVPQRPLQVLSPRSTAPPRGGTAPLRARPSASFPSPQPWPPRLRRLRRRRSEQRGGQMDGAAGSGEYGAGRAAWPGFPERQPDGHCQCWTAV